MDPNRRHYLHAVLRKRCQVGVNFSPVKAPVLGLDLETEAGELALVPLARLGRVVRHEEDWWALGLGLVLGIGVGVRVRLRVGFEHTRLTLLARLAQHLEPLEAGASKAEQEQGRECQQHLEEALRKEAELWTPQYQDQLSQHLSKQSEVCVFVTALDRSCNGLVTRTSAGMAAYEGDE